MTLEDKFAQFKLTQQAIENFKYIADQHAIKNSVAIPFTIETKVINTQDNNLKK